MDVQLVELPSSGDRVHVSINITADLNFSSQAAKRQVTGYLLDNVSDHLGCELPSFVVEQTHFLWRVPVVLYLTSKGKVGTVGHIDVDASTGKLLVTPELIAHLKHHATQLAERNVD